MSRPAIAMVLRLQRAAGNRAVTQLLARKIGRTREGALRRVAQLEQRAADPGRLSDDDLSSMAGELGHLYDSPSYAQLSDDERSRMWKLVLALRGETAARVPAWRGDEFVIKQEDREVKRRLHPLSIMFQRTDLEQLGPHGSLRFIRKFIETRDAYTALRFAQAAPALPAAPTPTGVPAVVAAPYPPDPVDAPPQASGAATTARG